MTVKITAVRKGGDEPAVIRASLPQLNELLADPDVVVWVNLDTQGPESQRILEDVFKFHPLLVEDAFADATTPKLEVFDDYLYLIIHGLADADPSGDSEVHTADLDIFIGADYLITHHRHPFDALQRAREAVKRDPSLLARGPAVVAHYVIDLLVDEFLPLMEKLDMEVDSIEAAIVRNPGPRLLERIFRMKHSLQRIRRVGLHQRDVLLRLSERDLRVIPDETRPFFRDVYDHFVKVNDLNEAYRDLMASSLDAYLSVQSHRLNEIMRILTVFSTVMLPLTFITGLYGMNFDFMPGLHWQFGYETAVIVMLVIAISMVLFFRRRRWL